MSESLDDLMRLLCRYRFSYSNEEELQQGIAAALTAGGFEFKREVHLNARDRIDFLVGEVGLEVKVEGNLAAVTRQLHRYAECPKISALILVTTRMRHGGGLPDSLNRKPLRVHVITSL
jgi:hypothetical protein